MRDTGVRVLRRGCQTQLPVHIDCEDLRGDPMGETFSDMRPQLVVRCVRHRMGATPHGGDTAHGTPTTAVPTLGASSGRFRSVWRLRLSRSPLVVVSTKYTRTLVVLERLCREGAMYSVAPRMNQQPRTIIREMRGVYNLFMTTKTLL